jgi:hypothetical protein
MNGGAARKRGERSMPDTPDDETKSAPELHDPPESPWRTLGEREVYRNPWIEAEDWTLLGRYFLSDGLLTQACYIYLATGVRRVAATPESTEVITIRAMSLANALAATVSGELDDGPTVLGVWRVWFHRHGH